MNFKLRYMSSSLLHFKRIYKFSTCLKSSKVESVTESEFIKENKSDQKQHKRSSSIAIEPIAEGEHEVDFFGFYRGDGVIDVGKIVNESSTSTIEIDFVNHKLALPLDSSHEQIYESNFGFVRYDDENIPVTHGQFEKSRFEGMKLHQNELEEDESVLCTINNNRTAVPSIFNTGENNIKPVPKIHLELEAGTKKRYETHSKILSSDTVETLSDIELDTSHCDGEKDFFTSESTLRIHKKNVSEKKLGVKIGLVKSESIQKQDKNNSTTNRLNSYGEQFCSVGDEDSRIETVVHKPITKYEQDRIDYIPPNIENPKTAFDYVMKLRKENDVKDKEKGPKRTKGGKFVLDSLGFKIYTDQVKDCGTLSKHIVIQILKESVLYNDHEILALYKPYGLAVQGTENDKSRLCLLDVLPDLAEILNKGDKLYTSHRIDRNTTGIILLAKTQFMANHLQTLFENRKIQKSYYGITKSVPDIKEGIINIPIAEGTINGKKRMVLNPDLGEDTRLVMRKNRIKSHQAVTRYKVKIYHGNAALVEFFPQTGNFFEIDSPIFVMIYFTNISSLLNLGVRHQIRVHSGFGLSCPILGDHKYSHLKKLAPQKLPGDVLNKLKVRQSKVRHIPMHLHSRSIMIPEIDEGKNIFIQARLPPHFMANLSSLKIGFSKKSDS
ncbi:Mitochondrial RNA pseudouridine synthase Rpusd4 [Nymphon striatum]|nr:Mitochondrial RNA pseudouridine synthase Rpusd4 [Nymphon striatum]